MEAAMDRHAMACRAIIEQPDITQRELASELNVSLGTANSLVRECTQLGFFSVSPDGTYQMSDKGYAYMEKYRVDGAVITAAGFGSRFVPLTFDTPKGLLKVYGESMIERQIRQLKEAGISDITIVVGYMKEKFEYLIDKYNVSLLYNPEYSKKNTLATLYHARELFKGKNMYILASDNWMSRNIFHSYECGSWYSSVYKEGDTTEWCLTYNKKGKISRIDIGGHDSWVMYGPAFFTSEWSDAFFPILEAYYRLPGTESLYWENVIIDILNGSALNRLNEEGITVLDGRPVKDLIRSLDETGFYINPQPESTVYEFENIDELREFDKEYQDHSDNEAFELISNVFDIPESEIKDIRSLKEGMTNRSFLFRVGKKRYICRIPGPGTDELINRRDEMEVFQAIRKLRISETIIYINPNNGYKISEFIENARKPDFDDPEDIKLCTDMMNLVHDSGIKLDHSFDIWERIGFYEKLCNENGGIPFEDYKEVHEEMKELAEYLDSLGRPQTIAHIDSCIDNFLILPDGQVRLIDWEYCGMCDPLIDVAMCAIYSYFDDEKVDQLIRIYFGREPSLEERCVIYSYVALGGFLWSLWAVYKEALGEEFSEYTIIMYRYAKRYYKKVMQLRDTDYKL